MKGNESNDPWKQISPDDHENHMSLESVRLLQSLNYITKQQLDTYKAETAMIPGVAGGNGTEHIIADTKDRVSDPPYLHAFDKLDEVHQP